MANREACEVLIEQEIEDGLKKGKKPYSIGKELSAWVEKLFEAKIKPRTIEQRARRIKNATNVAKKSENRIISGNSNFPQPPNEQPKRKTIPTFNETNENIEWAKWSWNPVVGCKHGCAYCYARDIANRFYGNFEPQYFPERLEAPRNTKIPFYRKNEPGINNVFVCSMSDLFGDWIKRETIKQILEEVETNPRWNFLFLTKNPKRYLKFNFPPNCWLGATADTQARAEIACKAFLEVRKHTNNILFLSCEPLMEKIVLPKPNSLDWLIIGGRSKSTGMEAGQPEWEWVESLLTQARKAQIDIYFKPNLTVRPKEYPSCQSEL